MTRKLIAAAALMASVMATAPAAAAADRENRHPGGPPCRPRVIDLGALPGSDYSGVLATDDHGIWVGESDAADGHDHAVSWVDGRIHDLGVGQGSWAADVNHRDTIVINGRTEATGVPPRAYEARWGRVSQLALPTGADDRWSSYVRRINDRDEAAGSITDGNGIERAAVWPHLGAPTLLTTPAGFTGAFLQGINEQGDVVGSVYTDDELVAWEWPHAEGSGHALAQIDLSGFSQANVIDDRGTVAGASDDGGQPGVFAALWRDGDLRFTARYQGGTEAFLWGGNGHGAYVGNGNYYSGDPNNHVFLTFGEPGPLRSLMPLSGAVTDDSNAHAISTDLTVGGNSQIADSTVEHATLWTCAPSQSFVPRVTAPSGTARPTAAPSVSDPAARADVRR